MAGSRKHSNTEAFIDYKDMNQLLDYVHQFYIPVKGKKGADEPFGYNAYIEDMRVQFKVSLKIGNKAITYITRKDSEQLIQVITGRTAYKTLRQYSSFPVVDGCKDIGSAVPLLYYNEKYNNTRQQAYAYDLNSAYSDAMNGPMPDTSKVVGEFRKVKRGEIGFYECPIGNEDIPQPKSNLIMVGPGEMADIIFNEMESPFKRFTDVWYNRKLNAKTLQDKLKAKGMLNYSVGFLQLHNPYIRATIVWRCNYRIQALIDDDTLYCNTDSLVSRVPRKDLTIGTGLGEWKMEHKGLFAYSNFNYQWDYDVPTYRGVAKAWFKEGWDILKDPIPESHNIFEFDAESLQLRRIDYGKEESRETSLQQDSQENRLD